MAWLDVLAAVCCPWATDWATRRRGAARLRVISESTQDDGSRGELFREPTRGMAKAGFFEPPNVLLMLLEG